MAWVELKYDAQQINFAARTFLRMIEEDHSTWDLDQWRQYQLALNAINNWRACHGYPLNTFQINLRHAARRFDGEPLIAQRTKRLASIASKLNRFPKMKLSQMQDIGGCRAVVKSVAAVRELDNFYLKISNIKHERVSWDDYISSPQASGYRGIHLVYRYYSDKKAKSAYNGRKIEMQLRSRYQHAWATAVETVGAFVREALKSSSGPDDWLRFFALMGTVIASRERTAPVPNTPNAQGELIAELSHYATKLNVENRLRAFGNTLRTIEQGAETSSHYYLLKLDPDESQLTVVGFKMNELERAQQTYNEAENSVRDKAGTDAVLVSVDSLAALRRAYPNYFADTRVFLELLNQALSGRRRRVFTNQLNLPLSQTS